VPSTRTTGGSKLLCASDDLTAEVKGVVLQKAGPVLREPTQSLSRPARVFARNRRDVARGGLPSRKRARSPRNTSVARAVSGRTPGCVISRACGRSSATAWTRSSKARNCWISWPCKATIAARRSEVCGEKGRAFRVRPGPRGFTTRRVAECHVRARHPERRFRIDDGVIDLSKCLCKFVQLFRKHRAPARHLRTVLEQYGQ
jgi:hypothetical protein